MGVGIAHLIAESALEWRVPEWVCLTRGLCLLLCCGARVPGLGFGLTCPLVPLATCLACLQLSQFYTASFHSETDYRRIQQARQRVGQITATAQAAMAALEAQAAGVSL